MEVLNVKAVLPVYRPARSVTSSLIVMIILMKVLTSVDHLVLLKQTVAVGKRRNQITLIGQDSMVVQLTVQLVRTPLTILQVRWYY